MTLNNFHLQVLLARRTLSAHTRVGLSAELDGDVDELRDFPYGSRVGRKVLDGVRSCELIDGAPSISSNSFSPVYWAFFGFFPFLFVSDQSASTDTRDKDLENDIDEGPPPEKSSKAKGKQREIVPDNPTSPIRPLPRVPPFGLGITTPAIGDVNWEGNEGVTGFVAPAGHSGGSLRTPAATTSSASSTASSSSFHNNSARSSAATSSSSQNFTAPLRSALANSKSNSSLTTSYRYASPSSTKFQSPNKTTNPSSYGTTISSSSASANLPSASSSKSPIPSSWASRPVDLSPLIPPQHNVTRGYTLPTPSNSRPPSQLPTPPAQQPSRARVSSVTGVRPPLGTSVPVVAYGNRNRSGSGSMGAGSSGSFGSRTIMGARTRSQSRTRTGTVNVSILPAGNGSTSRRSSKDRDRSVDASSQKSTSMPSSPVMKSLHMPFSTSPGTISSGFAMAGSSTTSFASSSSRPPRTLPSPVLPSASLNNFSPASSSASIARTLPRSQSISSSPRQTAVLSSSIANTTGKRALPPNPPSIPVGRPIGRREPSIPRNISHNTTPRKLPQPSLAAHIASISASPPRASSFASSAPPLTNGTTSSPSINVQPNFRAQSATVSTTQLHVPKDILTATTPLSYSSYSVSSSSIGPESEVYSHPMSSDITDILASKDRLDDDRSSLSSFRAVRRRGRRGSHDDFEELTDLEDILLGEKDGLSKVDADAHIHVHDPDNDHLDVHTDCQNYRGLSRSPSPMRYARPESMGLFSSSEDEGLGMGRRGRRGRAGGKRPPMTWTVTVSDRALDTRSYSSDEESGSAAGRSEAGSESKSKRGRRTQLRAFRNSYRSGPFVNGSGMDVTSNRSGSGHVEGSIGSNEVEDNAESSKGSDRWWKKLKGKDKDKVHKAKD
ncbi:hypothetical protein BJ165DRAFT_1401209 [Panaeolus papilionaceus]|nr:hypothetical protein BJ165DRAFT_1401209 [Panaeolus papilionaceus]